MEFNSSWLAWLVCPNCDVSLLVKREGGIWCESCDQEYPVINGIPRFVPLSNYADSFGMQWNRHRGAQLDSRTGLSMSRDRLLAVTDRTSVLSGKNILEAGSGAGRFTEVLLAAGAIVYSFDYSAAVSANFANNGTSERLSLFQADILRIPVRKEFFDAVLCLGVLQHTADPAQAFRSLAGHVRPGGQLVVDVYAKTISALLSWKYFLRPLTKRMDPNQLYRTIVQAVDLMSPLAIWLRRIVGPAGVRLLPIADYSHLLKSRQLNREWAILDTFDMYSPQHDHPQTITTVRRWFSETGFEDICVEYGSNGIVGRGRRPKRS